VFLVGVGIVVTCRKIHAEYSLALGHAIRSLRCSIGSIDFDQLLSPSAQPTRLFHQNPRRIVHILAVSLAAIRSTVSGVQIIMCIHIPAEANNLTALLHTNFIKNVPSHELYSPCSIPQASNGALLSSVLPLTEL
jgi:hypothetical protein